MIFKVPSIESLTRISAQQRNHRKAPAIRALQWFWKFSQFYGEYTVRSPQEQQQWIQQQLRQQCASQ